MWEGEGENERKGGKGRNGEEVQRVLEVKYWKVMKEGSGNG